VWNVFDDGETLGKLGRKMAQSRAMKNILWEPGSPLSGMRKARHSQ
jgi:hypothetical protein